MELRELGEMLRQRREETGLTLDVVVERTKISRRNLLAIEEARRDELPHAVYSKGFIRNYATVLDADMRVVNKALAEIFPEEEETDEASAEVRRDIQLHARNDGKAMRLFKGAVLLVLLVSLIVGVVLLFSGRSTNKAEQAAPAAPAAAPAQETPAKPAAEPGAGVVPKPAEPSAPALGAAEPQPAPVPAPAPAKPAEPAPASAAAKPVEPVPTPAPAAAPAPAPAPAPTQAEKPAQPAGKPGTVQVLAKEACWLEAVPGGGEAQEFFLRPGEKLTIDYATTLELRLGNGGGISVTHNGAPVKFEARSGEVKTLTFP